MPQNPIAPYFQNLLIQLSWDRGSWCGL